MIEFQQILDKKINSNPNYKIKICINAKFLTKHSNKLSKEFKNSKQQFINFKEWKQRIIKAHKAMKKSNNENEICIDITRWWGHVWNSTANPSVILRDNPHTFHSRAIYQLSLHKLYAIWMGADCNGDAPGNSTDLKRDRFLDSITANGFPGKRNQPHTQGLRWNNTMIKMASINDGDVNAAIYSSKTREVIFSCSCMCGVFSVAMIYSIIFNRTKMLHLQQRVLDIARDYKEAAKKFVSGDKERRKQLDDIRRDFMALLSTTAHHLMDRIVPLTLKPIKISAEMIMVTGRRVQMPARCKPNRGPGKRKQSVHLDPFFQLDAEMKQNNINNNYSVQFAVGTDFDPSGRDKDRTRINVWKLHGCLSTEHNINNNNIDVSSTEHNINNNNKRKRNRKNANEKEDVDHNPAPRKMRRCGSGAIDKFDAKDFEF